MGSSTTLASTQIDYATFTVTAGRAMLAEASEAAKRAGEEGGGSEGGGGESSGAAGVGVGAGFGFGSAFLGGIIVGVGILGVGL